MGSTNHPKVKGQPPTRVGGRARKEPENFHEEQAITTSRPAPPKKTGTGKRGRPRKHPLPDSQDPRAPAKKSKPVKKAATAADDDDDDANVDVSFTSIRQRLMESLSHNHNAVITSQTPGQCEKAIRDIEQGLADAKAALTASGGGA